MKDFLLSFGGFLLLAAVWLYVYRLILKTKKGNGEKKTWLHPQSYDNMERGFGMIGVGAMWFYSTVSTRGFEVSVGLLFPIASFALGVIVMIYGACQRPKLNKTADEPEPSTEEDSP